MEDKINLLRGLIDKSNRIVFFGGAGVSTESNIPDFRSSTGLYNESYPYPPERILSHSFFYTDTEMFYKFYRERMIYEHAQPNKAHQALVRLEQKGKLSSIITQNIDGLHQKAGSKNVFELHGSVSHNICTQCGKGFDLRYILASQTNVPLCNVCYSVIKPNVILYEEGLDQELIQSAIDEIAKSDLLIVGGTSLVVYPAAGFIDYHQNNQLVLINKSETSYDNKARLVISEAIGKVLEKAVE